MNIQITNIPQGQKIKSIDFKIEFSDSTETVTTIVTDSTPVVQKTQIKQEYQKSSETQVENIDIPQIDISKREPKIDSSMLDESF